MPDANQYPNTSITRKILPSCAGYVVTKFDPTTRYRTEEEIEREDGTLAYINGVDLMGSYDIELVGTPTAAAAIAPLTTLAFTNATGYQGADGDGDLTVLVRGDVKVSGSGGRAKRITFTGIVNAALPTPT